MKQLFIILIANAICILFSLSSIGQDSRNSEAMRKYEKLLNKKEVNEAVLKFCDPAYPTAYLSKSERDAEMEKYAKLHPPIPVLNNTNDPEADKAQYNALLTEWIKTNNFYPQFVPYHLFNSMLTPEDDIRFYELAREYWVKNNPEKYAEMNNVE